jgi:hypothetical protein
MPVKDCATLEAETAKDEPSRLVIKIALRQPVGAAPAYDATEIQRAIHDGFREIAAQVELRRLMKTGNPPKSWASRWAGRVVASPSAPRSGARRRSSCRPLMVHDLMRSDR